MTDGPDVSRLSPSDAVAALRSFPRRYRAILTSFEPDESPDDLVHRPGGDGLAALDHAELAARTSALLGAALRSVLVEDGPTLAPAVLDEHQRESLVPRGRTTTTAGVLDLVELEANTLADSAQRVASEEWSRAGTVAGTGQQVRALDLLREAVRTGSVELRRTQAAIDSARRG